MTDQPLDFQTLEFIHSRKTGALFIASAELGAAAAARSSAAERAAMGAFAKNLGLAFQIVDDLIDVVGAEAEAGKDVGQDLKKTTFVSFSGVDGRAAARGGADRGQHRGASPLSAPGPSRCGSWPATWSRAGRVAHPDRRTMTPLPGVRVRPGARRLRARQGRDHQLPRVLGGAAGDLAPIPSRSPRSRKTISRTRHRGQLRLPHGNGPI